MLVHRRVTPSIKFASTHLYTWVERGTVRVKCLAQEHNTMFPARARTRTAHSGVERTNHEASAPPNFTRWSGDVMKRPGHKKFNPVPHNRSRPEVLFLNLTWRSRGQISSVLLQLLLFADTGNDLLHFGNEKTTPRTTRGCGIWH